MENTTKENCNHEYVDQGYDGKYEVSKCCFCNNFSYTYAVDSI